MHLHRLLPISYEIHFRSVTINGQSGQGSAKIRADGIYSSTWIDLDTDKPLAPEYRAYVVKAALLKVEWVMRLTRHAG
ncbi:hypothetical protein LMG27174_06568 [Paraburkholderia rhynchosiae]|uniref:Uncharacterized protein n=1 Tax=Paraburkholderia rhynchosiae TaxID=487049 RepID=A0A2N7VWI0_9BURK|nr:hypothetical protein C0Z16_33785 [Paraburkholderia rhynchosiae]CAB3739593.1 hypothetical protein LMG27174_06568 [Paraburkholderia rhynchosiae]